MVWCGVRPPRSSSSFRFSQKGMFLLPGVIGAACTTATLGNDSTTGASGGSSTVWLGAAAAAGATLVLVAALQILAWRKRTEAQAENFGLGGGGGTGGKHGGISVLDAEDDIDFEDGCCHHTTTAFLLPAKRGRIAPALLHTVVAAAVVGLAVFFLAPARLGGGGAATALAVLGWLSVSNAVYSMTAASPTEQTVFRQDLTLLDLHAVSRRVNLLPSYPTGI